MIYLDNAATTPIHPQVIEVMHQSMKKTFGNPSSLHRMGREAKGIVEQSRLEISKHLNCHPQEIVFTAGGSEADNLVLYNAVAHLGVQTIITSKIEHHAILHTLEPLKKKFDIKVFYVALDENGAIDFDHLEELLKSNPEQKLVSFMFVNNEIGVVLDMEKTGKMCQTYHTYFHSDTVQGVGHFKIDVKQFGLDFMAASAHKFHGPKGVGFAYIKRGLPFQPLLYGGEQEHGLRAGTENIHSILGMATALNIAYKNLKKDQKYIEGIKQYLVQSLVTNFPNIQFNGQSHLPNQHAYHILNVRFSDQYAMFLFKLDLKGIACSGGSACQSGSNKGSHVLNTLLSVTDAAKTSVRFSFNQWNTLEEIDALIGVLRELID